MMSVISMYSFYALALFGSVVFGVWQASVDAGFWMVAILQAQWVLVSGILRAVQERQP